MTKQSLQYRATPHLPAREDHGQQVRQSWRLYWGRRLPVARTIKVTSAQVNAAKHVVARLEAAGDDVPESVRKLADAKPARARLRDARENRMGCGPTSSPTL